MISKCILTHHFQRISPLNQFVDDIFYNQFVELLFASCSSLHSTFSVWTPFHLEPPQLDDDGWTKRRKGDFR